MSVQSRINRTSKNKGIPISPPRWIRQNLRLRRSRNRGLTSDGLFDDGYFQQTEESSRFRQEYEMRKMKQDQGFDMIAEGLDTLKNMAHDMNEFRSSRNFCIDIVLLIIILGIAAYLYNVLKKDTS